MSEKNEKDARDSNLPDSNLPVLRMPADSIALPDVKEWIHRFDIKSSSSNRIYIIAQHKTKRFWGCSYPSWRTRRTCQHLNAIGLPSLETPYVVRLPENSSEE